MALDRLEAIRAFCRIVEVGSFTGAADALQIAKTTISGQIQALESVLGVKLLHRTTRKVVPTTDGLAYYTRARYLLDELDELESSIAPNQQLIRGRVKVEMPLPVGTTLIIPALPSFTAQYPQIELDIGCSERVVDLLHDGVDCAFRGGVLSNQDLVCRPLGLMRFCLCAAPSYLAQVTPITSPADLAQQRYLGFTFPASGKTLVPRLRRADQQFLIEQPAAMRFNNSSAYLQAGLAGLGIVSVPRAEAREYLQHAALQEVLPDWTLDAMPINLVYPYARHLSAKVRVFTQWATELMQNDPLWAF